ncbi:hypothetical protein BDV28DRAFT_134437 [Aspergillus coremiiformis]|uniref:Uncharacterized protein n=1 Tax=Aspergillus coremiiformis TaxID=138285 RepID=A0A5N6Z567_9EURO|nr:hypothetical protein BDV28DRAFT_134437 [Aspergillus coremiiformis]
MTICSALHHNQLFFLTVTVPLPLILDGIQQILTLRSKCHRPDTFIIHQRSQSLKFA